MKLTFELTQEQRSDLMREARESKEFQDAVDSEVSAVMADVLAFFDVCKSGRMTLHFWAGDGDLPGWRKDISIEEAVDDSLKERTHGGRSPEEVEELRFFRAEFLRFADKISKAIGE